MPEHPSPTRIGYAASDGTDGGVASAMRALQKAGCTRLFIDRNSQGPRWKRRRVHLIERSRALSALQSGDTLVVANWHGSTSTLLDSIRLVLAVQDMGASLIVLDGPMFPQAEPVLGLLRDLVADEKNRSTRVVTAAKATTAERGASAGAPQKVQGVKLSYAIDTYRGGRPMAEIARELKVHVNTLRRALKEAGVSIQRSRRRSRDHTRYAQTSE